MRLLRKLILIIALTSSCIGLCGELLAQIKTYDISQYGAKSETESLQTEFIQAVIDAASKKGVDKVIIPKGSFVSGSLILKSNVELYL